MYHPSNGIPRTANTCGYFAVHGKHEANRAATASHGEFPRLPSREGRKRQRGLFWYPPVGVNITVDIITKKTENNEVFDIYELMQGLSVDVIADCALAMKTNCQENPQDTFFNMVRDTFKHVQNGAIKFAVMFPSIGKYMVHLHRYSTAGQMTRFVLNSLKKVISERHENLEFERVDLLQLMMDNREDGKSSSFLFL
ncbi:hypothetical protein AVEN_257798-1 [Araneus ventricosus]|uniref:Uncharacterized protein n=1 Tax=Araneus ventricosus TaxID=182803 RepID=A0A4Y2KDA5_ARAVE|nr:hypothetical protein AVEN_257798-1 [Araneus ventricosus]